MRSNIIIAVSFFLSFTLLSACQPLSQSDIDVEGEVVKELVNNEEDVSEKNKSLFLDEIYGFYFQVPDSWAGYRVVYEPKNPKSLSDELIEGENLAFGAKKIIRFLVNDEIIIEFYIVSNEIWDELSSDSDGPLPFEIGSGRYNTFLYSINQGVQSLKAKKAMKDFQDTINDSFGIM